jgi:transposase-like protein
MDTPGTAVDPAASSLLEGPGSAPIAARGSTEIQGKPKRRAFTLPYKRRIVALASGLPAGEIGTLLRREGLYSSHLTHWRRLIAELDAKTPEPRRGRKPDPARNEKLRIEKLERELARTHKRLVQAEAIIDAQKKLCALLGLPSVEEQP